MKGSARAAFYRIPAGSTGLHHIVGMSDEYANDIKGFEVGPDSLGCGIVMYNGEPSITSDVENDAHWEPLRQLTRKHGCRACWSFPVRTKGGPIVGTLGIYFSEPRSPTSREIELTGILTHTAAIIISRDSELNIRTLAEEALLKNENQLKILLRLRDEFIANASHELNTPLTSMLIYAQLLEENFKESENSRNSIMVRKLREQVDRLRILIRDMLDNTNLAEGKIQLSRSFFDLNKLIREKVQELQTITKKHTLNIQLIPMGKIEADKARIDQVLTNLLANAIKYSPHGGEIMISSEKKNNFIKVSVIDCGIGIPEEDLENIFKRFYRVISNEAKTFPGMGIGLSICKDIIDLHNGSLEAARNAGMGSTFSFIIPIKKIHNQ